MDGTFRLKKFFKNWWQVLIIVLTPLVLLPLPLIIPTIVSTQSNLLQVYQYYETIFAFVFQQSRCAYIVILLTVYWVSEAMPYAVASLLPLSFFPLAGIIPSERVGLSYFKVSDYGTYMLCSNKLFLQDISTLFLGSMTLAHAMDHVHLHRRLALLVLSFVGSSIKW